MTTILLAEDELELYDRYLAELERAGFNVYHTIDGTGIIKIAEEYDIDIIVSDTKLDNHTYGYEACKSLLDDGKLKKKRGIDEKFKSDFPSCKNNEVFIIGMSTVRSNDEYWIGIAHEFYHKDGIYDLGKTVRCLYDEFQKNKNMRRYKVF